MKLASKAYMQEFFSRAALFGAIFFALSVSNARAAELVMFERAGCIWCEAFDREIAPIYGKTEEGLRAPLRRVDTAQPVPPDLAFIEMERLTPLFVLIDGGREIGRIRGYPGEDFFWGLLGALVKKLDASATGDEHAQLVEKPFRAND
jgi:thioredoxin-related protein